MAGQFGVPRTGEPERGFGPPSSRSRNSAGRPGAARTRAPPLQSIREGPGHRRHSRHRWGNSRLVPVPPGRRWAGAFGGPRRRGSPPWLPVGGRLPPWFRPSLEVRRKCAALTRTSTCCACAQVPGAARSKKPPREERRDGTKTHAAAAGPGADPERQRPVRPGGDGAVDRPAVRGRGASRHGPGRRQRDQHRLRELRPLRRRDRAADRGDGPAADRVAHGAGAGAAAARLPRGALRQPRRRPVDAPDRGGGPGSRRHHGGAGAGHAGAAPVHPARHGQRRRGAARRAGHRAGAPRGISMGGNIAQLVAIDHPQRVLSLTSIGADSANRALPLVADPEAFAAVPPRPPPGTGRPSSSTRSCRTG